MFSGGVPANVAPSGLNCNTPYGFVAFGGTFVNSAVNPQSQSLIQATADAGLISGGSSPYRVDVSIDLRFAVQQTFIATGGTGIGILQGSTSAGGGGVFNGPVHFSAASFTTPFGEPLDNNPYPLSYEFIFGQPFTLSWSGEISFELPDGSPGSDGFTDNALVFSVIDQSGKPISATFTPITVPEPKTTGSLGAGLLVTAFVRARQRFRRSWSG
jgi:hypothetical protein